MITSVAEYYINEIEGWKDSIIFHLEEIDELELRFEEILRLDTIPNLATKAENNLKLLFLSRQNLINLKQNIQDLEAKLLEDHSPVINDRITEEIKRQQNELRKNLHGSEKEYLDVKYNCDSFLAETFGKQFKV